MTPRPPPIRPATPEDAAEIARLLSPQGHPMTEGSVLAVWAAFAAEGNVALVVPGAEGLRGVITLHRMSVLHRPRPVGRITALGVDPPFQGQGLGRALVAAAEQELARAGCGLVEVTSHARRTEAHAFYRHLGYQQTSHRFARDLSGRPS